MDYPPSATVRGDEGDLGVRQRAATLVWTLLPFAVGLGFGGGYVLATFV